jgi:hypothetical protein
MTLAYTEILEANEFKNNEPGANMYYNEEKEVEQKRIAQNWKGFWQAKKEIDDLNIPFWINGCPLVIEMKREIVKKHNG